MHEQNDKEPIVRQREIGDIIDYPHSVHPMKRDESGFSDPIECHGTVTVVGPGNPESLALVKLACDACEFTVITDGLEFVGERIVDRTKDDEDDDF